MPLTELQIKHLKPKPEMYRVLDSEGLWLEVTPTGKKSWRWRFYYNGKNQTMTLGYYPDMRVAQARRERDKARELVREGKHPNREKKIQKMRNIYSREAWTYTCASTTIRWGVLAVH